MNGSDYIKYVKDTLQSDSRFADVDMSESSVFYNLQIIPAALMAKPILELNNNTLNSLNLNTQSSTQIDGTASNFFITRKVNDSINLQVVAYFTDDANAEPILISTNDEFLTSQNQVFYSKSEVIAILNTLPLTLINGINYRTLYIDTQSTQNYTKISPGAIASTSFSHNSLYKVTNLSYSSDPISTESDEDFITRIKKTLTNRNNVNINSIITNVSDEYPNVSACLPICYGDSEMQRDISVAAPDWSAHFGGMTDIYIRTPLSQKTITVTATKNQTNDGYIVSIRKYNDNSSLINDGLNYQDQEYPHPFLPWQAYVGTATDAAITASNLPILRILNISGINPQTLSNGEYDYSVSINPNISFGKNYRYSEYEQYTLNIKAQGVIVDSIQITISYLTIDSISDIQDYFNKNRIVGSSNIVKSFLPIYIKKLVVIYDSSYTFNTTLWATTIADKINNWNLNEPLRLSTLLKDLPAPVRLGDGLSDLAPFVGVDSTGLVTDVTNANSGRYSSYALIVQECIDGSKYCYYSPRHLAPYSINPSLSSTYRTCKPIIQTSNISFIPQSF